ncbi:MAG: CinA family nicotinamide mononucleotide deamidase-related protein [Nitrospinota bacterium]|nr:CinA family nicotinamide mononucleotide deamidase-related protein [Nitrospinota bacterium]
MRGSKKDASPHTRAEIIAVGTEILLGDLLDTNSVYLAEELKGLGINLHLKTVVGDNLERLTVAIASAHERAELVITSGGLGPTVDDLTREAVAAVAGVPLVYSQELMDQIEGIFTSRGFTMSPNNRKQAYLPEGAKPIENPVGTAPCFIVEDDKGVIIVLPGVPRELKFLMESRVIPYLRSRFSLGDLIRVRVLKSCALGESHVDHLIHDLFESSRNPSIAVLAHPGQVDIRLTAKGSGEEEVERMLDELEGQVRERLGAAVFGVGRDTVEEAVGRLMRESGKTLAIIETITGGALAARLTGIAGGAPFFKGGWVASSPDSVAALLGREGPVEISAGAAEELAHAVTRLSSADMGLAVFGPIPIGEELAASSAEATHIVLVTGDESEPPVSARRNFGGGGRFLQDRAAIMALDVLRRHLLGVELLHRFR